MTSSSPVGMHIQFRTLMFYSRLEEQLQERSSFKESASSLLATIRTLGSPLGPHLKNDLGIDLYSGSTPIANIDEFDRRINFNRLNKFVISLSVVIEASGSPSVPHPEIDLATDLYFDSTLASNYDEMCPSDSNDLFRSLNT
jgi:hypothetical protein